MNSAARLSTRCLSPRPTLMLKSERTSMEKTEWHLRKNKKATAYRRGSFLRSMKKLRTALTVLLTTVAVLYLAICALLWFEQEKLIFHPSPLAADYQFNYSGKFEEVQVTAFDGKKLHGLLFRADTSKGLVFYLHGNAGALD